MILKGGCLNIIQVGASVRVLEIDGHIRIEGKGDHKHILPK